MKKEGKNIKLRRTKRYFKPKLITKHNVFRLLVTQNN